MWVPALLTRPPLLPADGLAALYRTGIHFFALAYCGSNLREVARLLKARGPAADARRDCRVCLPCQGQRRRCAATWPARRMHQQLPHHAAASCRPAT